MRRLAPRKMEAPAALGVSWEVFSKHIAPQVRCVRVGSVRLYPVTELQAYLDQQARLPLVTLAGTASSRRSE